MALILTGYFSIFNLHEQNKIEQKREEEQFVLVLFPFLSCSVLVN
jgi:hypothetical protein